MNAMRAQFLKADGFLGYSFIGMAGFTLLSLFSLCGICGSSDQCFNGSHDDNSDAEDDEEKKGQAVELPERAMRYSIRARAHDLD